MDFLMYLETSFRLAGHGMRLPGTVWAMIYNIFGNRVK